LLPSSLPFHTVAVGTAWSLLGSPPNGKAELYTFQKTFQPYWKNIQSVNAGVFEMVVAY
jgi:Pyruvate/2-oxoacid:ferredoxin oxidoreductase gamma subunit